IDLVRIRSFDNRESFLRVAFPEDDRMSLPDISDKDIIRMWTLKESFLKILGLGFAENLRNVRILEDCFIYKGVRIDSLKRDITEFDGHILSTVWGTVLSG
ncbi:MAG TPA: 4'-phosphopantetheinyl transferase superfamily protein, partial [Spirochaetota bacterium]|nr:4'-phosphopantetheinyl transferase superfamily protein [Spirochaetota bacterium]